MSQGYSCVTKRNSTVMVIIKLKIILNEKVGYRFCQVIRGGAFPPHYTSDLG